MKNRTLLLLCILTAILCTHAQAKIIYVDDDAAGANNGLSWQNAYKYLQDALTDAKNSEKPVEIRVAQGTYKPNLGRIIVPPVEYPSHATFSLINNVTIKGGYAGVNEPDPNVRNVELCESILNGDLDGDDIEVEDPCDLPNGKRGINSLNVVSSNSNDANAVLDGFTIKGGACYIFIDPGPYGGAGMRIYKGNPIIINCTFFNNIAPQCGGGIYIVSSSPTLIGCTFTRNYAEWGGGICNGTTVRERKPGNPTFINCVFSNNYATSTGGGLNGGGNIVMSNCTLIGNISEYSGGGLYSGNIQLENCIFTGNRVLGTQSSLGSGGACSLLGENTIITNCTFNGNWAYQDSAINKTTSSILNISNSIIWDGQNSISDSNSSDLTVTYSDIQGGLDGEGNINIDPLFSNPGYWADANDPNIIVEPNNPNAVWIDGDYHLKSQAGRWDSNTQSWVQDDVTSPCIDTGNPNSPIGLEPFPNGGRINMGAYGGTAEASKSYFGKPVCQTIVAGDINGDCKVDILDFEIMLLHWMEDNNP